MCCLSVIGVRLCVNRASYSVLFIFDVSYDVYSFVCCLYSCLFLICVMLFVVCDCLMMVCCYYQYHYTLVYRCIVIVVMMFIFMCVYRFHCCCLLMCRDSFLVELGYVCSVCVWLCVVDSYGS